MDREADQVGGKSAWICAAIDHFLRTRDQKPDQMSDQERRELEDQIADLRGLQAVCEERVKGQALMIEDLRAGKVHLEGMVQELMSKIPPAPAMITDGQTPPGWWSRLFGRR